MILQKTKNNKARPPFREVGSRRGFVMLFAVTLASILLAIALGVAQIALKEVNFATSAKGANDAFVAADTGAECALFYDKLVGSSFPIAGPATPITCASATPNNITPIFAGNSNTGSYDFVLANLGGSGGSCAKVNIYKDKTSSPMVIIITSKGYNVGDASCNSTNANRTERVLTVSSLSNIPPPPSPSLRSSAQAISASGVLSLSINKPAGTSQSDVMVASVAFRPSTAIITPPSGWTLIRRLDNSNPIDNSLATYYKVAGISEPGNYAWSFNTSAGAVGGIMSFSNTNTSSPINVENGQNTSNASLNSATPNVTASVANTLVVTIHSVASSATWTPPSLMNEAVDTAVLTPPNNGGESIEMNYVLQSAAGATGVKTASQDSVAGVPVVDFGNSQILVLQP